MLKLKALDSSNFQLFALLMGGDEFGGCYCAVWTSHDDTWVQRCSDPTRPNLQITRRLVEAGSHVGYLVYESEEVIGWTGSGPKVYFPLLAHKLASRLTPSTMETWSIGCLAVKATARANRVSERIVAAILAAARVSGAAVLEAYPTRPWDEPRSYRGSWRTFERLGFHVAGSERDSTSEILLMQLDLK